MQSSPAPAFFDQSQAASYDERASRLAPMLDALHFLSHALLNPLPEKARILCVGAGTGGELLSLAERNPGWTFTAVEPAEAMIAICQKRVEERGFGDRCSFHHGYLDSLPADEPYHAATSILVSQFLTQPEERSAYFKEISQRLIPGGHLVNADLSGDTTSVEFQELLRPWADIMSAGQSTPQSREQMHLAYSRNVGVIPAQQVQDIILSSGFESAVPFFQTLLIHAWHCTTPA